MTPTVAVLGTLDTKAAEVAHLAAAVVDAGGRAVVIDTSAGGAPTPPGVAEVTVDEVALAAGRTRTWLGAASRADAVRAVADGVAAWLRDAAAAGRVDAVVTAGGSNAALVFQHAAAALPFGRPKLAVTTMAAVDARTVIAGHDVTLLYPVTDVDGLNHLTRTILTQAGAAVVAMARVPLAPMAAARRGLVGATMFGITTSCVQEVRRRLEHAGDEVVVFHANGTGGRSLERLAADGRLDAVVDVTTTELADLVAGGQLDAGDARLDPADRDGPPRVVVPGAVDTVNFGAPGSVPAHLRDRPTHRHNDNVTLVRTDPDENRWIGERLGAYVAAAPDRLVVLPLGGVSSLDVDGGPFRSPAATDALVDGVRRTAAGRVRTVDAHVNDPVFAAALVAALDEVRHLGGAT